MIDGVSAATSGEIRRLEQARGRPGEVARDLACWERQAAEMRSRHWDDLTSGPYEHGYHGCPCCGYGPSDGRWGLERVLRSLSRRARREFAAVVGKVDIRVLDATYGSGPDTPGWWEQRF
ncbi:hypothetical protein ACFV1B_05645 [Streptomyces sp. NPDC059637]|uniref:hypothetical protein n=1 Tax=Streptomyces sp. NPDC059637 TaxID=3347752 RepID=UPI0036C91E6F